MNFKFVVFFLLGGFIVMMSTLVYKSVSTDFYLVSDKYYDEGVNHNDKQNKLDNVSSLKEKVKTRIIEDKLLIQIPTGVDSGLVVLYRPSNGDKDISLILSKNQSIVDYNKNLLDKGKWIAKIDWSFEGKRYYTQEDFFIKE